MARDKASPRLYAYLVPRLRYMLTKLAREDKIRDVIAQPSIEEAAGLLRDTLYGQAIEPGPAWRVQAKILEAYARLILRIARSAPEPAKPLAEAFLRELEARDALTAASMLEGGSLELEMLPTANIPGTLLYEARSEQETLASTTRLLEALRNTWLKPYVELARSLEADVGPRAYQLAAASAGIGVYSQPLETVEERHAKPVAVGVLCPLLAWRAAAIIIDARSAGLQARSVERLIPETPSCRINPARLRTIYERDPTIEGLIGGLREELGLKLDPQKPPHETLEEARTHARREAKRRALQAFAAYPFHSGLIAASLTLAKLEAEDIATILTSIQVGLSPEEYLSSTTYRITV